MGRRTWRQLGSIGTWDNHDLSARPSPCPADGPGLRPPHSGPEDFKPLQECCFCDGPLDTSTRIASDSEDDSGSVASEGEASACSFNMTTLEAVTSMAASLAAVAAFKSSQGGGGAAATSTTSASPQTAPGLYPLGHHGLLPAAWYLSPPHAAAVAAVAAAAQQQQHQQDTNRSTPLDSHSLTGSPVPGSGPSHSPGSGPSPAAAAFPPSASPPGTGSPGAVGGAAGLPCGLSPADMPMPLDLSAKAALAFAMERDALRDSLRVPDSKNIFKARPRANTALTQRRTYTEDELQAALRDIQSGKLGTRRAAVIYGIPRSTLRNKVYKLTMERKCDPTSLVLADPARLGLGGLGLPVEDDDGALSPGEEELAEKALKSPLDSPGALAPESLRLLLQHGMRAQRAGGSAGEESEEGASPPPSASGLPGAFPDQWALQGLDYNALAPYISKLLGAHQSLLVRNLPGAPPTSGGDSPGADSGDFLPKFAPPLLPDFLFRMIAEERAQGQAFHNGSGEGRDGDEKRNSSPTHKSEADDETRDGRPASPGSVILKIPSFKPSKNGGVDLGVYPRAAESSPDQGASGASGSQPTTPAPAVSPTTTAQILANKAFTAKLAPHLRLGPGAPGTPSGPGHAMFDLKRTHYGGPAGHHPLTESVIKSMQQAASRSNSSSSNNQSSSGNPSSGKGTRPKRGKYRNYDRDALNEAVKAVQRGEMSVHRAGSFYGVPHSTLEYKVKERHLMRPRKRDPKPQQPADDKAKQEQGVPVPQPPSALRLSPGDKMPMAGLAGLPGLGGLPGLPSSKNKPFIQPAMAAPQNGLKPRFDPAALSGLPAYPGLPFPFWGAGYSQLPLDFSGQAAPFNANTKPILTPQMIQRLQEAQEGSRSGPAGVQGVTGIAGGPPGPGPGRGPSPEPSPSPESSPVSRAAGPAGSAGAAALALGLKRSRDADEGLDDSSSDNNTLLDGIIRRSLEKGLCRPSNLATEKLANNALLDQLCRLEGRLDASRMRQRTSSSSEDDEVRRPSHSSTAMHRSPSSDGSDHTEREILSVNFGLRPEALLARADLIDREDKNSYNNVTEDGDVRRDEDERLPRSAPGPIAKPFHLNHSPPRDSGAAPPSRPPLLDSHPSGAVNGVELVDTGLVKSASACDSKLIVESRTAGGGIEEDGAKDSSEDQVCEDTKTQDIS